MEKSGPKVAATLCLIGTALIFLNTLAITYTGSSIIVSPYPVSSIDELIISGGPLWYRIAFGVRSLVEWPLIIVWLVVSVMSLALSAFMYLKPQKLAPGFLVLVLSICLFLVGGGFFIGSFLAILGSGMSLQRRKPIGETFFGKLIRVARLDSKVFSSIKENPKMLREAAITIIFVNFLSGIGGNLYIFNVDKILDTASKTSTRILLRGETLFDLSIFGLPLMYIGLSVLKWIMLSLLIYLLGSKLLGEAVEFDAVARVTAFAYAPVCLQFFMPLIFLNQPYLTVHWPLFVVFITNFWMIFALIVAMKVLFEITTIRAMGIVLLAGSIYWLLIYKFILPPLFTYGGVAGIFFEIKPPEMLLMLFSLSAVLSLLFGTFSKH